jgi:hypothetical protein
MTKPDIDAVLNSDKLLCDICYMPLEPLAESNSIYGGKLFVHKAVKSCNQHWLFLRDGSTKCKIQRPVGDSYIDKVCQEIFNQVHFAKGMLLSGFFTENQYTKFLKKVKENQDNPWRGGISTFLPRFQESYKKLTDESQPVIHPVKKFRIGLNFFIRSLRLNFENLLSKLKS